MKNRVVIVGVVGAALAVSLAFALKPSAFNIPPEIAALAHKSGKEGNMALFGTLQGFEPGAKVSYNIFPDKGQKVKGAAVVDARGDLKIPPYNMYNAAGKYLSYDIHVDEGKTPINMTLTFNSENGKIAVKGTGLREFSDVGFENASTGTRTKTDWAGIISSPDAGSLGDIGDGDGFKVALFNDIMSDVPNNPKIIKVLAAPGGGTFNDPMLNQYMFPYGCNDGIDPGPDWSFCDNGKMDDQIDKIVKNYVTAFIMMTEQLTAVMGQQVFMIGTLIDAKQQLETQREFQRLTAQAHKDYHPSQMMCEFGSFVRTITTSEEKSRYEKMAINSMLNGHYFDTQGRESSEGPESDVDSRVKQFREVYCDPKDNNDGLHYMCDHDQLGAGTAQGAASKKRMNKDIDYNRTLDQPLTLDIDMAYANSPTGTTTRTASADEEDIIALGKNLYWPTALAPGQEKDLKEHFDKYMNGRQLYAMLNVAHNSYASIAGMKAKTSPAKNLAGTVIPAGADYMKSMMRNFGLSDADINAMLGDNPSYYAQMEVLTKKMYQDPDFYTNLYDKPVNVKRIGVTLAAINIMQQRDTFESALRREMLTSLMVEQELSKHVDDINGRVVGDIKNLERR